SRAVTIDGFGGCEPGVCREVGAVHGAEDLTPLGEVSRPYADPATIRREIVGAGPGARRPAPLRRDRKAATQLLGDVEAARVDAGPDQRAFHQLALARLGSLIERHDDAERGRERRDMVPDARPPG